MRVRSFVVGLCVGVTHKPTSNERTRRKTIQTTVEWQFGWTVLQTASSIKRLARVNQESRAVAGKPRDAACFSHAYTQSLFDYYFTFTV